MGKRIAEAKGKAQWDNAALVYIDIDKIKVGKRFRKDPSKNAEGLAKSIKDVGLLQFPLVDRDMNLICGERRLTALRMLGKTVVPVVRADIADPILAQMAENEYREAWTPQERMACILEMGKKEKGASRKNGKWIDRVGKSVGLSGSTVRKAFEVMQAGEENPERFGDIAQKLRGNGKVDGVYREFNQRRTEIRGIQTKYKGVEFRSLTEARWAALFDMRRSGVDGWKYEPLELAGWIPDFEIRIGTENILVETKAETNFELLFCDLGKIERSGARLPVWKLGAGVFSMWPDGSGRVAGIIQDFSGDSKDHCWRPLVRPAEWAELWKRACFKTRWMPKPKVSSSNEK